MLGSCYCGLVLSYRLLHQQKTAPPDSFSPCICITDKLLKFLKKCTVQFTTKWFYTSHTSKARCCCCTMPNLINNWVEQYNLVLFWSIPSLISDRSYSAPVLPSVLLHLWQSSSVRKLWSIWSTNYILCAMTTCTLLLSAKYAPPLHFPEVCAVTCHPS